MTPDKVTMITGNVGKAKEFSDMLGIPVTPVKAELTEIQSLDPRKVAVRKVADAYDRFSVPVLVDDTALAFAGWKGLPGALVAWWIETVGPEGILSMAESLIDRSATATAVLGYADADGIQVFSGTVDGEITTEQRGASGFGWDSLFIPDIDPEGRTYAQMSSEEKNAISHRRLAVNEMRKELGLV